MMLMPSSLRKATFITLSERLQDREYSQHQIAVAVGYSRKSQNVVSRILNPSDSFCPTHERLRNLIEHCEKMGVPTDV